MSVIEVHTKQKGLSPTMKLNLANHIYNSLEGNSYFTNLYPTPAILLTAITNYSQALTKQQKGNKESTAVMKDAMRVLMRTLKVMAAGVEYLSNDEETIALSSGFFVKVHGVKTYLLLSVKYGIVSGSVNLYTKKTKGACYKWQYSLDPVSDTSWEDAGESTIVKHPLTGLVPGRIYWFRVAVVKGNTREDWGSPISIMVL